MYNIYQPSNKLYLNSRTFDFIQVRDRMRANIFFDFETTHDKNSTYFSSSQVKKFKSYSRD